MEAWHEPVRAIQKSSSEKITKKDKYWVRMLYSGGVCTGERLMSWGYNTDGVCKFCGSLDTIAHRVWLCPHGQEAREEFLKRAYIDSAVASLQEGTDNPRFTHGWTQPPQGLSEPL